MRQMAVVLFVSMVLTACGGVTEEMLEARESAIAMMEKGDYEEAVSVFNRLVEEASKVTAFELDILKYRAEAEFLLEDYAAAVHTYQTLMKVDEEKPEYCYFASMSLARDGQTEAAFELLENGKKLDETQEAAGFFEASMALAECYEEEGMTEAAQAVYRDLISDGYGNTDLYNRLMIRAMSDSNYETALEIAAQGLRLTDGLATQELKFNEAVCYEYLGDFTKALELFRAYVLEYGSDERVAHEITFLETR